MEGQRAMEWSLCGAAGSRYMVKIAAYVLYVVMGCKRAHGLCVQNVRGTIVNAVKVRAFAVDARRCAALNCGEGAS